MTQSTHALSTAYEALRKAFPDRKIGNISVEPARDHYQVMLVNLPVGGEKEKVPKSTRVSVNRESGAVGEIKDVSLAQSPYLIAEISDATISGKRAFDLAFEALKGFQNYDKEGKLTVELVRDAYHVTFPQPLDQEAGLGADYAVQVWINCVNGSVVKTLVAS